jgi:predicted nuclease of predicted toxin-antitoxin system
MIRVLADENFDANIVRGIRRRLPTVDLVRVQDVGLRMAGDPPILARAANEGRVLLTHDVRTMTKYANERLASGLAMPGVIALQADMPIGQAVEEVVLVVECSLEGELEGQIRYLPL